MRTRLLVIVLALVTVPFFAAAPKSPMKPGKWEITMQMIVPGVPENMKGVGMLSPMTIEQCITKEEAEKPQPPKMDKQKVDCEVVNNKIVGKTVTWSTRCRKPQMTMDGKFTFSGDTYKGESHVTAGDRTVTYKYSGKYLGACDKKKKDE